MELAPIFMFAHIVPLGSPKSIDLTLSGTAATKPNCDIGSDISIIASNFFILFYLSVYYSFEHYCHYIV